MSSKETILEALKANSPAPVERGPLGFTPMTFSDPLAEFRERAVKAAAARCILIEEGDDKASADTELSGNRATNPGDRTPEEDATEQHGLRPENRVTNPGDRTPEGYATEQPGIRPENRTTNPSDRTPEEDKSGSIRERIASIIRRTYPEARRIASNLPEAASCATFNPDELEDPRDLAGTDVAIVRGAFGVVENGAVWIPRAFRHKAMLFIPEALVILLDRKQIVCNMHEAYAREDFDTYDFGSFIAGPSKTADIEQALVIGAHGARDVTVILL